MALTNLSNRDRALMDMGGSIAHSPGYDDLKALILKLNSFDPVVREEAERVFGYAVFFEAPLLILKLCRYVDLEASYDSIKVTKKFVTLGNFFYWNSLNEDVKDDVKHRLLGFYHRDTPAMDDVSSLLVELYKQIYDEGLQTSDVAGDWSELIHFVWDGLDGESHLLRHRAMLLCGVGGGDTVPIFERLSAHNLSIMSVIRKGLNSSFMSDRLDAFGAALGFSECNLSQHGPNHETASMFATLLETVPRIKHRLCPSHFSRIVEYFFDIFALYDEDSELYKKGLVWCENFVQSLAVSQDVQPSLASSTDFQPLPKGPRPVEFLPMVWPQLTEWLTSDASTFCEAGIVLVTIIGKASNLNLETSLPRSRYCFGELFKLMVKLVIRREYCERVCRSIEELSEHWSPQVREGYLDFVGNELLWAIDDDFATPLAAPASSAFLIFCQDCDVNYLVPFGPDLLHKLATIAPLSLNEVGRGASKAIVIGCRLVSEILIKLRATNGVDEAIRFYQEACNSKNPEVAEEAARALSYVVESCGSDLKYLMQDIATALRYVIENYKSGAENTRAYVIAVKVIGAIIDSHYDNIYADEVVPLWLSALPLQDDLAEAKVVHELLCSMLEWSEEHILGPNKENVQQIISILSEVVREGWLTTADTCQRFVLLLRHFREMMSTTS